MLSKMTVMLLKVLVLAGIMWIGSCASPKARYAQSLPATAPAASQPVLQPALPPATRVDPDVDALLTRLERSADDLTSFDAKIVYEREESLLGRTETRSGEIIYRIDGAKKSFAVLFDKLVVRNESGRGRLEDRLYHYIFDGRWLAEIDHESKHFTKTEIVPPGKRLDPLKLGEGPFPLPIGQPKSDVLARFDVSKIDVPKEGLLSTLTDVDGLLLIPKASAVESKDYKQISIFYDRATLLPVGINAIEANENRKTVKLTDMQRNPKLDAATLKKLDISDPDPRQWHIDIQPWKGEG